MEKKGYLLLADGQLFEGRRFGADKDVYAELVFTTGMVGYLETLTDPAYLGQIVIQTFPSIGNYGVIREDLDAPHPMLSGYVVRDYCDTPSNFRCEGKLDDYLREEGIPGLCGVDTRQLTRRIRNVGVMNAALLMEKPVDIDAAVAKLRALPFHPSVNTVSGQSLKASTANGKYHVVLWDFNAKTGMQEKLESRGCRVTCVPAGATAEEILALKPDGLMPSNGPGDPADNIAIIEQLALVQARKIPTFGVGLGHQLLALSQGAKTRKLKYGHRGANQSVRDLVTSNSYITSQNHGYAVDAETLPVHITQRFINGNDGTCEGVDYQDIPAFSVQFAPEINGGPLDTMFLYDRFIQMMGGNEACR